MVDDTPIEDAQPIALEDKIKALFEEEAGELVGHVESAYQASKTHRQETENRWLKAYTNFRGRYGEDVQFLDTEKSRVFVKVTKTKTLAAYGQILDVMLGGEQFPISVQPTEKPEGAPSVAHIDPQGSTPPEGGELPPGAPSMDDIDVIGFAGDGNDLVPGEDMGARAERTWKEKVLSLMGLDDKHAGKVEEGPANEKGKITIDPAQLAADAMTLKIQDQLTESNMTREFRKFLFECVLLGSGCIKGPFISEKEYPSWDDEGNYDPLFKDVPISKFVSAWNLYPDPNACSVDDCEFIVERHRFPRNKLRKLAKQPYFRKAKIEAAIAEGPNYTDEFWETNLREGNEKTTHERYEVLEYWGVVDTSVLMSITDFELPEELQDNPQVNINAFICNGKLLRLVVNPFKPSRLPYQICPYEEDPYNIFGVGLPENMEDSQTLMNGFTRMAVDNAVLSGNIMVEVDEDNLAPGQSMDIYAGKVWRRQGGNPGQSINAIQFPNTAPANMQLYQQFRQLADESTGISSFSHGQTGVSGVGRTASGISMLMNAASVAIKTVIKNIDDYLLEPMGKAYFAWNMQFDYDENISGNLEVKPQGVSTLLQKEVKSQRLLQFTQITAGNPEMAARTNMEYILKEIAKSLELDPKETVLSPEEAALKMEQMSPQMGGPQSGPQMPQAPGVMDPTGAGGGNIGTGEAPMPGEAGFSANTGEGPIE